MSDWIDDEVDRLQKQAEQEAAEKPRNILYTAVEVSVSQLRQHGFADREIYLFMLGEYGQTGGNWYIMSNWLINDFLELG